MLKSIYKFLGIKIDEPIEEEILSDITDMTPDEIKQELLTCCDESLYSECDCAAKEQSIKDVRELKKLQRLESYKKLQSIQ